MNFHDVRQPLDSAFRYFRAQLDHLPVKADWPRRGDLVSLLRGFVVSTQQLCAGAVLLIADDRPKPLVLPAGVLARALVEGLGNVLALLDDPSAAIPAFLRDDYRNTYRTFVYHRSRFGESAGLQEEERMLGTFADTIKLSPAERTDPERHLKDWPTPGHLLKAQAPPRLTGQRRKVFEEVHGFWYRSLSALSHHRLTALQIAAFTEQQQDSDDFLIAKSMTVALAVLVALCVLSEVEHHCHFNASAELRVAWERARDLDEVVRSVYACRYAALLGMD